MCGNRSVKLLRARVVTDPQNRWAAAIRHHHHWLTLNEQLLIKVHSAPSYPLISDHIFPVVSSCRCTCGAREVLPQPYPPVK